MVNWLHFYRELTVPAISLLLLGFLFFLMVTVRFPALPRTWAYGLLREFTKIQMDYQTRNWQSISDNKFVVKYQAGFSADALLVLETVKGDYQNVSRLLNYDYTGKIPLIIYPDKQSLNISFGWDSNASAMGVYWAGGIRILAPGEWAGNPELPETLKVFQADGPIAHEITHLLVDYRTGGNYTRWLTEGIAQYVERTVTGFQFPVADTTNGWYTLKELEREYDSLADQSLAYYQSLLLIDFLVSLKGEQALLELLDSLSQQQSLAGALKETYDLSPKQLEQIFRIIHQSELSQAG